MGNREKRDRVILCVFLTLWRHWDTFNSSQLTSRSFRNVVELLSGRLHRDLHKMCDRNQEGNMVALLYSLDNNP